MAMTSLFLFRSEHFIIGFCIFKVFRKKFDERSSLFTFILKYILYLIIGTQVHLKYARLSTPC